MDRFAGRDLPLVIQGGMGVGISGWPLAREVALTGNLGVVSGAGLDVVHSRRLQDGDPGGHLRRAYARFPIPGVAERVLARWYQQGGREPSARYRAAPVFSLSPSRAARELAVVASFAEVWLAKDGHDGLVGVNHLEKVNLPMPYALYGALLAGVDVVLVGAGIPAGIPSMLTALAAGGAVTPTVPVEGRGRDDAVTTTFDPATLWKGPAPVLRRPAFLAIVASATLALFLARQDETRPDGFVVEEHIAGGHNAPPRGRMQLDDSGQPVYGVRDEVDLAALGALGLPFWLAGGYGHPERLRGALAAGAAGVQVGTAFALCDESGLRADLKCAVTEAARTGNAEVFTDPLASPSGYPFKTARLPGTLTDRAVYDRRQRVCDLGLLRVAYSRSDGSVGFRCPSEPVAAYVRKGGDEADTVKRMCLCNTLLATIGLGQVRDEGTEPPLVTMGDDVNRTVAALGRSRWSARDVVAYITGDELAYESDTWRRFSTQESTSSARPQTTSVL